MMIFYDIRYIMERYKSVTQEHNEKVFLNGLVNLSMGGALLQEDMPEDSLCCTVFKFCR